MINTAKISKSLLMLGYILVFLAGLGTFTNTMGCVPDGTKHSSDVLKKETTAENHFRLANPIQMLSHRFF